MPVDEIYLDEEWKRSWGLTAAIGFRIQNEREIAGDAEQRVVFFCE